MNELQNTADTPPPDAETRQQPPQLQAVEKASVVKESTKAAITLAILEDLYPTSAILKSRRERAFQGEIEPIYEGYEGFTEQKLVDVCRLLSLGLSMENACRAACIPRNTLQLWRDQDPGIDREIKRAKAMAIGAVTKLLRQLMTSTNEAVALNAIKFWLSTRVNEFKEKHEVEIEVDLAKVHRRVVQDIYGNFDKKEPEQIEAKML